MSDLYYDANRVLILPITHGDGGIRKFKCTRLDVHTQAECDCTDGATRDPRQRVSHLSGH